MKFKRINVLLITTLVLIGYLTASVHAEEFQKPMSASVKESSIADGLPKDISPEQMESLETEKFTFQVRKQHEKYIL